ncbi:MAG: GNAT family N-acetyltransferase [Clostridiales bacterium]|jgi:RimJ/RimL family protein N-acetyltransferase/predicted nucleotidyltransferase|nr:GNAT family N-acetyltransferase [Clostridiales bacterium]
MKRRIYLSDEILNLSEYIETEDDLDCYNCWQDEETQSGYNHKSTETFEKFSKDAIKSRFIATIIRQSDNASIGSIFISPEDTPPDLAIMIFKPYRGNGYGTRAFLLGVKYCFEVLSLDYVYAGCYPHNIPSMKMLQKCGFQPHPEGNKDEKHYLTGKDIIQLDFIKHTYPITETRAMAIVGEFLDDIRRENSGVLALYVIGSLGGGYYRPGQSDIDTVIIVSNDAEITQKRTDEIAKKYWQTYEIPKGFGSIMIRLSELSPPYIKSEAEEFEFTVEIARLKTQGKAVFGGIDLNDVQMPSKEDFIKDALIMERWFAKEFGYPMFDKLQITGCVNTILGCLRRYLMIEKGVFEFNKFLTIEIYLRHNPPIVNEPAFDFINKKLKDEIAGNDDDLRMLRECGIQFRDYFNMRLLNLETSSLYCGQA